MSGFIFLCLVAVLCALEEQNHPVIIPSRAEPKWKPTPARAPTDTELLSTGYYRRETTGEQIRRWFGIKS